MKKTGCLIVILFILSNTILAQKKNKIDTLTLSPEQTKELLNKIKIDSTVFIRQTADNACKCIGKIKTDSKGPDQITEDIARCIDKEVQSYQLVSKINKSFGEVNSTISLVTNKNSNEYKSYYYDIERWLRDSCESMNDKIVGNESKHQYSTSFNSKATKEYNKGIKYFDGKNFKDALPYFEKAVAIDSMFAFAWDNIGVCNRQMGNYDAAIVAYRKSLALDPEGITPLYNLPVVYRLKKDFESAIIEYKKIVKIYPNDPETFYGLGQIYLEDKIDLESSLDNFCKAYTIYVANNSPYRSDAEKNISNLYSKFKKEGKEKKFEEILKNNNISQ